jgi:hypothetical protein
VTEKIAFTVGLVGLLAGIYMVLQIADRALPPNRSNAGALWVKNETAQAGRVM